MSATLPLTGIEAPEEARKPPTPKQIRHLKSLKARHKIRGQKPRSMQHADSQIAVLTDSARVARLKETGKSVFGLHPAPFYGVPNSKGMTRRYKCPTCGGPHARADCRG